MSNELTVFTGFEDLASRVNYAYKVTQRQYDEHPPNGDLVPIADAINGLTLICGCYMGIEQTMKLLVRLRGGTPEKTHALECLYLSLDPLERDVFSTCYRVYRSLHNFDSGGIALDTAEEFIRHIGNGYVAWRYILTEGPQSVPKLYLGSMLETWRVLVNLVQHRIRRSNCRTVADHLDDYIMQSVYREAEHDDEWQGASQDQNSGVEFRALLDWFYRKGRPLEAGIDLFTHHARGTGSSIQASPLLRRVLLRAADKAVRGPFPTQRQADIIVFHQRIRNGGLSWNADKKVFKKPLLEPYGSVCPLPH